MIKINVIGSGVVGYATGRGFIHHEFDVTFVDINQQKIDQLISEGYKASKISELNNLQYESTDVIVNLLAVPTPTVNKKIDLTYLKRACEELANFIKEKDNYQVVVTRSTLPPGTTYELAKQIEKLSGKTLGKDFGLCMNPEYLRAHNAVEDFDKPWIVVIGAYDDKSFEILETIYKPFNSEIHRLKIEEAEFQKYVHNLLNANKISFFNEFRSISNSLGLDTEKIFQLTVKSAEAIWNPKYGTKDMGPFGGVCLPKDTQAFLTWAEEKGYDPVQLRATIEVNDRLLKDSEKL